MSRNDLASVVLCARLAALLEIVLVPTPLPPGGLDLRELLHRFKLILAFELGDGEVYLGGGEVGGGGGDGGGLRWFRLLGGLGGVAGLCSLAPMPTTSDRLLFLGIATLWLLLRMCGEGEREEWRC